jgi:pilus assembly protein TadC
MKLRERIYISMTNLLPKGYLNSITKMARFAGEEKNIKFWIGSISLFGLLLVFISFFLPFALYGEYSFRYLHYGIIGMIFCAFMGYVILYFKMQKRVDDAENYLPDVLQLISVNLRAGLTAFAAIKIAGRGEFGCLSEELKTSTTKALGLESFSESLLRIKEKINSTVIERVMKLISTSLLTGGHLADLLKDLSDDIRATQTLKKEMVTKTKTYTAFILFTILFGTPVLLAISIQFVSMISGITSQNSVGDDFNLGLMQSGMAVTPEFLIQLSISMLFVTCLIASLLMGVINKGSMKYGLKYAPFLITAGIIMFFFARFAVLNLFTTIV